MTGSCDPISERHREQRARRRDHGDIVMIGAFAAGEDPLPSDLQRRFYQAWQLTRVLKPRLSELLSLEQQLDDLRRRHTETASRRADIRRLPPQPGPRRLHSRPAPPTAAGLRDQATDAPGVQRGMGPAGQSGLARDARQRRTWVMRVLLMMVVVLESLVMFWSMGAVSSAASEPDAGTVAASSVVLATLATVAVAMASRRQDRYAAVPAAEFLRCPPWRRRRDHIQARSDHVLTADLQRAPPSGHHGQVLRKPDLRGYPVVPTICVRSGTSSGPPALIGAR